jgi:hypothetical protein
MFYQIAPASGVPPQENKDGKKENEKAINGIVAVLACILSVGLSGYVSLVITDPDQGKLVTMQEMSQRQEREIERIKNSPHMPPQAKRMALAALERSKAMGDALRSHKN